MAWCTTFTYVLPKAKRCDDIFYDEGDLVLLEIIGLLVVISKYFRFILVIFCIVINVVRNMIYFVILGGVLLVIFVVSIMMRSIGNFVLPFITMILRYVGGLIFILIVIILLLL